MFEKMKVASLDFSDALSSSKMVNGAHALLWMDLETTGDDKYEDEIIEIGAMLTDFNLEQIGNTSFEQVITPTDESLGRMMKNHVVREMHLANGLIEDILSGKGVSTFEAQKRLLAWLTNQWNSSKQRGPIDKYKFMLAGSGVSHFDKFYIDTHLIRLADLLVYAPFDIGHTRRAFKIFGCELAGNPSSKDQKNHRALDDVRLHLEEAKFFKTRMREQFVHS